MNGWSEGLLILRNHPRMFGCFQVYNEIVRKFSMICNDELNLVSVDSFFWMDLVLLSGYNTWIYYTGQKLLMTCF